MKMCGRCVRITPIKVSPHEKKLKEGWWSIMYLGIVITKNDLFSPHCRLTNEHASLTYVQTHTDPHIYIFMRTARITLHYPAPYLHPYIPTNSLNLVLALNGLWRCISHTYTRRSEEFLKHLFFVAARSHLPVRVVFIRGMEVWAGSH